MFPFSASSLALSGLLRAARRAFDDETDLIEGLENVDAGFLNGLSQRGAERAVAAGAVEGDVAGLCRK